MAKMIFMNIPGHGHVNPTLAVVAELKRRGNEIIYYNTEEFRPQLEQAGAEFRPYPVSALNSGDFSTIAQGSLVRVTLLLFQATEQLLPFMLDELQHEQPNRVVYDSTCLWGMLSARQLKLSSVSSITTFVLEGAESLFSWREFFPLLRDILPRIPRLINGKRRLRKQFAEDGWLPNPLFPCTGDLNIVFTSRQLQPDTRFINETFRFVGPSIDLNTRDGDFPADQLKRKPVIYISLGTVNNTNLDFYRQCFNIFANFPGQFILSAGRYTDLSLLGEAPSNFQLHNHVPQLKVLQHADLFVSHGGMNSIQEALYYGVPLVMMPHHMEQLANAKVVARTGAGLIVGNAFAPAQLNPEELRDAVQTVLDNQRFRQAARTISASLHAAGGYMRAADEIMSRIAYPAALPV